MGWGEGVTESEIQSGIKSALTALGFHIYDTSNRKKMSYKGVPQKGIPDLLIVNPDRPFNLIGLEVKKPGGKIKPEQKIAVDDRHYAFAYSTQEALLRVADALEPGSLHWQRCLETAGTIGGAGDAL